MIRPHTGSAQNARKVLSLPNNPGYQRLHCPSKINTAEFKGDRHLCALEKSELDW